MNQVGKHTNLASQALHETPRVVRHADLQPLPVLDLFRRFLDLLKAHGTREKKRSDPVKGGNLSKLPLGQAQRLFELC